MNEYVTFDFVNTDSMNIGVTTNDSSVYKAKAEWNGKAVNATVANNGNVVALTTTLGNTNTGKLKIFCNKSKVTGLKIDVFGLSSAWRTLPVVKLDWLSKFPNLKYIGFNFYNYGNDYGGSMEATDWSQIPDNIEVMEFLNTDFPQNGRYMNINNFRQTSNLKTINNFYYQVRDTPVYGNLANLPPNLTVFKVGNNGNLNGGITGTIPTRLTQIAVFGTNSISGTIPSGMTYLGVSGSNTLMGTLPYSLTSLNIQGNNTVSGDLPPNLTGTLNVTGSNTVSGNISNLVTYVTLQGNNTVSGNIPTNCTNAYIGGNNTISGTIPAKTTVCQVSGNNTLTGNIPPNATFCVVQGNNTLTGNIPNKLTDLVVTGNNTLTYSSIIFPSTMSRIYITASALTSAMVDQMLIDLANVTTWINQKQVYIKGNSGARTSMSNIVVATLQSKGVTVTTN